jgi:hypothetical protein
MAVALKTSGFPALEKAQRIELLLDGDPTAEARHQGSCQPRASSEAETRCKRLVRPVRRANLLEQLMTQDDEQWPEWVVPSLIAACLVVAAALIGLTA